MFFLNEAYNTYAKITTTMTYFLCISKYVHKHIFLWYSSNPYNMVVMNKYTGRGGMKCRDDTGTQLSDEAVMKVVKVVWMSAVIEMCVFSK